MVGLDQRAWIGLSSDDPEAGGERTVRATANCQRALSLPLIRRLELPDRDYWVSLGRWLADTPPSMVAGLQNNQFYIAIAVCKSDGDEARFQADLVRFYLERRLPPTVKCRVHAIGQSGQLNVEIRNIGPMK